MAAKVAKVAGSGAASPGRPRERDAQAVARAIEERQARVYVLVSQGQPFTAAGREVGVSHEQARKDFMEHRAKVAPQTDDEHRALFDSLLTRLADDVAAVFVVAETAGDQLRAIDQARKIIMDRGSMLLAPRPQTVVLDTEDARQARAAEVAERVRRAIGAVDV